MEQRYIFSDLNTTFSEAAKDMGIIEHERVIRKKKKSNKTNCSNF